MRKTALEVFMDGSWRPWPIRNISLFDGVTAKKIRALKRGETVEVIYGGWTFPDKTERPDHTVKIRRSDWAERKALREALGMGEDR